jgi:hypothetical protein
MKSWVMSMAICGTFMVSANIAPLRTTPDTLQSASQSLAQSAASKPLSGQLKKSKNNRLPRWHRVIPEMFS